MAERPSVVVGVIAYRDNGDIFLIRSRKWGDRWVVPGGHVKFGEHLLDTVRREMKEETNLDVDQRTFIGIEEGIFPEAFHERKHFIYIHYAARAINSDVHLNDEAQEYMWTAPEQALQMDLVPSVRELINQYISKSPVQK